MKLTEPNTLVDLLDAELFGRPAPVEMFDPLAMQAEGGHKR